MLTLNVVRVMKLRAVQKPYAFLTANGFTHHTTYRLLHGKASSVSFVHLERLCRLLRCTPHDLLDYTPPAQALPASEDTLAGLKKESTPPIDVLGIMRSLSLEDMNAFTADLAARHRKAG
jgi:DNA-binding Xre family transcriptional regulator